MSHCFRCDFSPCRCDLEQLLADAEEQRDQLSGDLAQAQAAGRHLRYLIELHDGWHAAGTALARAIDRWPFLAEEDQR